MALFNNFPWTNTHEMNLAWIIEEIKKVKPLLDEADEAIKHIEDTLNAAVAETEQKTDDVIDNVNTAIRNSTTATNNASAAAQNADNAADKIRNLTASAVSVSYEAPAQVTVRDIGTGFNLAFGIPQGAPGAAPGYNLLDNSDFTNPVNQRGLTTYTYTEYTIDRWYGAISSEGYVKITNTGIEIKGQTSGSLSFIQYTDTTDQNKVYTFVVTDINDNNYSIVSSPGERLEYDTPFGTIIAKMVDGQTHTFGITVKAGSTVTLKRAALYAGDFAPNVIPAYLPKGYMTELINCRQYFQKDIRLNCIKTSGSLYSISKDIYMHRIPTVTFTKFSPYGATDIDNFANCQIEMEMQSKGIVALTYASLPTCSAYSSGGLAVTLNADLR